MTQDEKQQPQYAGVIIDISHEKVDRPFQYRIPEALLPVLEVGMCVKIPFGQGNTVRTGYVIEITGKPEIETEKIKSILDIDFQNSAVEEKLIRLAWWMKRQYGSTMIQALKTVLPAKQKMRQIQKKSVYRLIDPEQAAALEQECSRKHQAAKARVLHELIAEEMIPEELLSRKLHIAASTLQALEKQGLIRIMVSESYRNPVGQLQTEAPDRKLSPMQEKIVREIFLDFDRGIRKTYLVYGITGSGKTEVYMDLIKECVSRGKQAIVLIPEIALTYQTVIKFYKHFGDRVSVMNSTLSAGEKFDQCERARKGEIDVVIGPRSALFTPFPHIGLIILDEEHEPSYKSETMPKYHARDAARFLAELHHASVVLGSATPSMESYYRAREGEYGLFELKERLTGNTLPEVCVADMRRELREGNRSVFSRRLQEEMEICLNRKEQMILFLNRRGYAGFVSCRNCGHVMKCPHCDVSLSEHQNGKLVCHYCGYEQPGVKLCPECGSRYIMGFRAGTEQVEEKLRKMYPSSRILRMDGDTTRTRDSYEKILSQFAAQEADILLGTQMIVKGHDFPNVTLVGALAADMSLFANDYRAAERTFQLLTQVAGRAGRGDKPGKVVIQTYQPGHYSILHAADQDYEAFYEEEMLYREMASYPPASHMLAVLISDREEQKAWELARGFEGIIRQKLQEPGNEQKLNMIGPAKASVSRINDYYRLIFYLKSPSRELLIQIKDEMENAFESLQARAEQIQFDFDPMTAY